jgi:DNA-binding Xre family transcriptional regulator
MDTMPIRWKLKEVLEESGITAYQLMKESGVAGSTIYRLTGGKTEGVQGKVLDSILTALHTLTGKTFDVGDEKPQACSGLLRGVAGPSQRNRGLQRLGVRGSRHRRGRDPQAALVRKLAGMPSKDYGTRRCR